MAPRRGATIVATGETRGSSEPMNDDPGGVEQRENLVSTYTQIYYHIVFSTKNRTPALTPSCHSDLFRYVWGIIKNHDSVLYRINGTADHIHLLSSLHQSVCLADFVKDIKTGTSKWIKQNRVFPAFSYWQEGYGAFTHSNREVEDLTTYIKGQDEHHHARSFREEFEDLLAEAGLAFEEKYLD